MVSKKSLDIFDSKLTFGSIINYQYTELANHRCPIEPGNEKFEYVFEVDNRTKQQF